MANRNSSIEHGSQETLSRRLARRVSVAMLLLVAVVGALLGSRYLKTQMQEPIAVAELDTDSAPIEREPASTTLSATEPPPPPSMSSLIVRPDIQPPSIPSNLQVIRAESDLIEITWDPSIDEGGSSVGGYQVFRDGMLLEANVAHSASPGFVDATIELQGAYTYGVLAFDSADNFSAVRQITVRTPPEDYSPPNIPSNLKVLSSDTSSVTLSWNESTDTESGLIGYRVYRDGDLLGRVSEPWFHDANLQEQTSYIYMISAIDDADPPNESVKRTITVTTQSLLDPGR